MGVLRAIAFGLLCAGVGLTHGDDTPAAPGASLRARYLASQDQLANNQFGRPLFLESSEGQSDVTGDIYALVESPFETAGNALSVPANWCEILILHVNTKGCRVTGSGEAVVLSVWIGRNRQQTLAEASHVDFAYRVGVRADRYLRVGLDAGTGPMGTRDYRIRLEAIPVAGGKTFIHLGYSYGYGSVGRLAIQTYLATLGRSKVGFTVVGTQADGQARHIGGLRGIVERNAMRYYAAIDAFLGAQSLPPQARFERRIRDWYATTELYPRQLHEVGQREYLEMKRSEYLRQQAGAG